MEQFLTEYKRLAGYGDALHEQEAYSMFSVPEGVLRQLADEYAPYRMRLRGRDEEAFDAYAELADIEDTSMLDEDELFEFLMAIQAHNMRGFRSKIDLDDLSPDHLETLEDLYSSMLMTMDIEVI